MKEYRRSKGEKITRIDRLVAGFWLLGLVFVWALFLIPGSVWLLVSYLFPQGEGLRSTSNQKTGQPAGSE
jgi:hypothetical protein